MRLPTLRRTRTVEPGSQSGIARLDRRTKRLVGRLRPGDIAIIDHVDIDRVAADSLAPKQVGALMFPWAQRHVDRAVLVSDDAIRQAQRTLWQVLRVVAEPGGATAFAALQSGAFSAEPGQRVGVLLCGANTDAVRFAA